MQFQSGEKRLEKRLGGGSRFVLNYVIQLGFAARSLLALVTSHILVSRCPCVCVLSSLVLNQVGDMNCFGSTVSVDPE